MIGFLHSPAVLRSALIGVVGVSVALLSACAGKPATPTPTPIPTPTVSISQQASPSSPAPALKIPKAIAGELARVLVKNGLVSSEINTAKATGREYFLRAECRAAPDILLAYTITVDGDELSAAEFGCGESVLVSSIGKIRRGAAVSIEVELNSDSTAVTGYLVVVPTA